MLSMVSLLFNTKGRSSRVNKSADERLGNYFFIQSNNLILAHTRALAICVSS